ncbi:MAG TPA: Uma2 family endonuclease [Pirellulales bacterium]|nr:Uma2 family endonuclease [Pirellulales bacterium]
MATTTELLTAEEFLKLPDSGRPMELVRGVAVMMNMPGVRHGEVCGQVAYVLKEFLQSRDLGRVITNDSGIVTERRPDTVRGPDIAYYSYARMPRGPAPVGYPSIAPEVVFEIRSPSDTWSELFAKTAEYLKAGVLAVVLCDPDDETLHVCRPNSPPIALTASDTLVLAEIHDEFRIVAARFFESS